MPSPEDLLEIARKVNKIKEEHPEIVAKEAIIRGALTNAEEGAKARYNELKEGRERPLK